MQGNIASVTGTAPGFGSALVGDHFVVTASFDTNAALLIAHTGGVYGPGERDDYSGASLVLTLTVGASGPIAFTYSPTSPTSSFNRIIVRDGAGDQPVNGSPADGISLGLMYEDFSAIGVIFRTDDLSVVNGLSLPENPYLGMAAFPVRTFQYFGDSYSLSGDVTSVSRIAVPEPGTLALLGLGLAGLGMTRRRKAA